MHLVCINPTSLWNNDESKCSSWLGESGQQTTPILPRATLWSQKGTSSKADIFKRKGRRAGGSADWQGLKRDTISWWPDGPADKMLIGSWALIGFTIYWKAGGAVGHLCWLFDSNVKILHVCVCVHTHMLCFPFLFSYFIWKLHPTGPARLPEAPCEQTEAGYLRDLAVSLRPLALSR